MGNESKLDHRCNNMIHSPLVPTSSASGVLDSGCTSTLLTPHTPSINKTPTLNGLRVGIPNGHVMTASHDAELHPNCLPIPLNRAARKASVLPHLQKALISLGQLCDNGCEYVILDKHYARVVQAGITSIIGLRDPSTGLWLVDLEKPGLPQPLASHHTSQPHFANSA